MGPNDNTQTPTGDAPAGDPGVAVPQTPVDDGQIVPQTPPAPDTGIGEGTGTGMPEPVTTPEPSQSVPETPAENPGSITPQGGEQNPGGTGNVA